MSAELLQLNDSKMTASQQPESLAFIESFTNSRCASSFDSCSVVSSTNPFGLTSEPIFMAPASWSNTLPACSQGIKILLVFNFFFLTFFTLLNVRHCLRFTFLHIIKESTQNVRPFMTQFKWHVNDAVTL